MNNVAAIKSTKTKAPKTPGGISKSLLTPCRRVGLSRNWKKAGPSPFVSPVSGNTQCNVEVKVEKKDNRKRKEPVPHDETDDLHEETSTTIIDGEDLLNVNDRDLAVRSKASQDIDSTPTRHIALPCKKKSRLLANKDKKSDYKSTLNEEKCKETVDQSEATIDCTEQSKESVQQYIEVLSTPTRQKSLTKIKKPKPTKANVKSPVVKDIDVKSTVECNNRNENTEQKSPNNLTKECVVVIQKRIFKTKEKYSIKKKEEDLEQIDHSNKTLNANKTVSQTLFDSDSDDVPLSVINKNGIGEIPKANLEPQNQPEMSRLDDDDDFTETKKVKVAKLVDKNTSTGGLKPDKVKKQKLSKPTTQKNIEAPINSKLMSQNSFEDDDDFEFETKRTILIRKTYDKVSKPVKAKTTGSITQKDIDELKARIEVKKKALLAKAMTEETKELRDLIKKWQKGCQDALAELMDLMKSKCPEKKNMDYSEMLQMLQIPSHLVCYDAEDDCFNTPDDSGIILSKFND